MTSEDVKFSLDVCMQNEDCVLKDLLSSVRKVVIVDEYTVDIMTKQSNPILLNRLVDIFIISKAALTGYLPAYQPISPALWETFFL